MNYLYYDTPISEFQNYYGNMDRPFTHNIQSRLPQHVAVIRALALTIFAAILLLTQHSKFWAWPVALISLAYAGWTLWTNLLGKDPLVNAFYEIVGGKDKYDKLPDCTLKGGKSFVEIEDIWWPDLQEKVSKAVTEDGRKVLIVKCHSRDEKLAHNIQAPMDSVMIFIEKMNHYDYSMYLSDAAVVVNTLLRALVGTSIVTLDQNVMSSCTLNKSHHIECRLASSMTAEMANEFRAQL